MNNLAPKRTISEIRTTGVAWITESELEWLCDLATEELLRQDEFEIEKQHEQTKI